MKKIMFVDDEEDVRFVVKVLLEKVGFQVDLKPDASFINQIDNNDYPDLYLLDRNIDGMDLLDVCRQLKKHPKTKHIPVIMLSADPRVEDLYRKAGADAFISKPFQGAALIKKITSLI